MELQHFSHHHPLIFHEDRENNYRVFSNICYGSRKRVSGPNYSCKECFEFVLHKSCVELPRELRHPLHPEHPLLLTKDHDFSEGKCEGCNRDYLEPGFNYHCFDCNFDLDRNCASLPLTIQPESHAHPLTLMQRSVSFTCDACGKKGKGKGMFYTCVACAFWVHLQCASFPLIVKHIRNTHSLNLTNSLQVPQSYHRVCQLCVKKVDTDNMIYYCSTCDYVNHLHCATDQELWDDTEPNESTSGLDESIDSFPYVILKSQLGKDKIEKPVEIKHFSHEHDLKLIDEQLKNNEKCDVCTWPIYHGPFYTCAQCRFFLHKSCVELPTKKSHPLHRHPLILLPEPPYVDKHFECDACKRHCNGFTYHCDKCRFDLDIQCSLIPDIFNHEGHEHQLILSSASSYDECSSCDDHKGQIFRCADCEFILDFKCATLPRTIKYGPYEQLFKLSYKDEDDYSDKYYCDICEEERNPEHWFYYCADLSFSAHPGCILGRFPYIMCGRTCRNDISGEHLLTLVDKSEDFYRLCDECGSLCCGLTYECVKCVFSVYRWCFHKTTALTRLAD